MRKLSIFLVCCMLILQSESVFAERYYRDMSNSSMQVSFGEKLDKYSDRFPEFSESTTMLDRFLQLKDILPDEVPVVEPFEISGNNEIYVSPNGDDENPGTIEKPLKTVQKAVDTVSTFKKSKKRKNTVIYLREGTYIIDKPIEINDQKWNKSGEASLTISAYENENVHIGGGALIYGKDAKKVTPENTDKETYDRIPVNVRDNIYTIDYETANIDEMPGFGTGWKKGSIPDLSINSQSQSIARYPNGGDDEIEEVIRTGMPNNAVYYPPGGATEEAIFVPMDKTVFTWKDTGRIGIKGSMSNPWSVCYEFPRIDKENQTLGVWKMCTTGWGINTILIYASAGRSHFHYYNALEALDLNGEWMADDENRKIYFSPSEPLSDTDVIEFGVRDVSSCFDINNVSNVIINGLNISYVNNGVYCKNSYQVVVQNCKITNCTGHGMDIIASKKCGVTTSVISLVGTGVGIYKYNDNYEGTNFDVNDVVPDWNFVMNSSIRNTTLDGVALESDAMGCIVSHNLIADTVGCGIINSGYWQIIEYNEFTSNSLQGVEGGTIYNNGGYTIAGEHIRNNYFHDSRAPLFGGLNGSSCGAVGMDDLGDGMFIYNNIFENIGAVASGTHAGSNHVIYDNIYINCKGSFGGNSDYFKQDRLEKSVLIASPTQFPHNAEEYVNGQYARVFPERAAKLNWVLKLRKEYQSNSKEFLESEKFAVLGADMGIFMIDNKCVNSPLPSLPNFGLNETIQDDNIMEHPADVPTIAEQYKNVTTGNETLDNIDMTKYYNYNKIGPSEINVGNSSKKLKIIFPGEPSEPIYSDYLSISWLRETAADFYRVTVAYDENFSAIAFCQDVHEPNVNISLEGDCRSYWYKVEAYANNKSTGQKLKAICSSDVFKVDYESTYEPLTDGEIYYGTPKLDGIKDEIYTKSTAIEINTPYNKLGKTDIKKKYNTLKANYAWDDTYLYVYAEVNDEEIMSAGSQYIKENKNSWQNDVVEMYLNKYKFSYDAFGIKMFGEDNEENSKIISLASAVSVIKKNGDIISDTSDISKDDVAPGFVYNGANGYAIEARLPLKEVYGEMFNGKTVTIGVQNNDFISAKDSTTYYNIVNEKLFILKGGPDEIKMSFDDVDLMNWYYKSVSYMYKNRLISGVTNNKFEPYSKITAGMFALILARLNEEKTDSYSDLYGEAIAWAQKNNIFNNMFKETPSPEKELTREEAAAMLYNYSLLKEKIFVYKRINELKDMSDASEFGFKAVDCLYRAEIVSGDNNLFNFKNTLTRAELCEIIYNYIKSENGSKTGETEGITQ